MKRAPLKQRIVRVSLSLSLLVSASVLAEDCIQLRVVGVCIWIICTSFGCDIEVTPKIGHFNPDVLVQVTHPQGAVRVEDPTRTDTYNRNHSTLIQQDAVAVGHPLTGRIYCPSNTRAGSPYFVSTADQPSWRWGGLDALNPAAWIPGQRDIGRWPLNRWGPVYPRTGWTLQAEAPKAAAVIAQRVGDIITRQGEPHQYRSILGKRRFINNKKITWSPGSLLENTNKQGWWQPTSPKLEQCLLFGRNDRDDPSGWGGGRVAEDGNYRHALWRPYTCCQIRKGALIVIDFSAYPSPEIKN